MIEELAVNLLGWSGLGGCYVPRDAKDESGMTEDVKRPDSILYLRLRNVSRDLLSMKVEQKRDAFTLEVSPLDTHGPQVGSPWRGFILYTDLAMLRASMRPGLGPHLAAGIAHELQAEQVGRGLQSGVHLLGTVKKPGDVDTVKVARWSPPASLHSFLTVILPAIAVMPVSICLLNLPQAPACLFRLHQGAVSPCVVIACTRPQHLA